MTGLLWPRLAYLGAALASALVTLVVVVLLKRNNRLSASALVLAIFAVAPLTYQGLVHAQIVPETYVRFGRPIALLLPAAASLLLAWRLAQLPARMTPARRRLVVVFSSLAAIAASLAVSEPELGRPLDRMTILMMLDRSRSIELVPGADHRMMTELKLAEKGMRDDDRTGTVVFAAEAVTEDPPRPKSDLPPPQRVEVGRDGTNLDAAIRRALAELPSDTAARLVLMSDGVQTQGDALSAAAAAVAAGVPIDVVPLDQKVVPDVRVVSVRAPPRAGEGEALDFRVVIASTAGAEVDVRVKRDGALIRSGHVRVGAGEDVLRLRETATEPGLHRYDVEVSATDSASDGALEDNSGSTFVRVRGKSLALILEGDSGKGQPMARALEASGFKTIEHTASGAPDDVGAFAAFDLVVLSDVRASELSNSQISAIASYTRDLGGGLVLMGGDRSLGPGGYARTPIEEVSPVDFDLKDDKRRASLAEVIAIDYSGSMSAVVGGQTKLALANEASARSASILGLGDRLGVEHVDTSVAWTVPMGPVTDAAATGARIRGVAVGGGGIYTDIALREGYAALAKEKVNLKHLLLFADGNDAEQLTGCRALVSDASRAGITTSVISLGRGSDTPELEALSKAGDGRFYLIEDATKLPSVFTQETILASKSAIKEEPFSVRAGDPTPATRGIDWSAAPPLRGYVVTQAKPRAQVALAGPEGDPILTSWAVGIGRAAAFTSDFKDRWGAAWLAWPGAAKLMGQLGRDIARREDDPRVRLESDASSGELRIRADVVDDDGRAQTFRRLNVHVAGPDGFSREVQLEATGAGRYSASVPLSRPGTYVATAKDALSGEAVGTTGAVLSAGFELRPTGSDRALLTRIATMTGGKTRDTLAGLYQDRAARRFAYSPVSAPLVLLAAVAMLLGVASRRLGVPEWLTAMTTRARERARLSESERRASLAFAEARDRRRQASAERTAAVVLSRKDSLNSGRRDPVSLGDAPPAPTPARARPLGPAPAVPQPAPTSARKMSAAELLAQKRRGNRR